tara:strand:- start:405 stop:596 length:192 start_codon:yes stop_codon:yes gene_type:complete
LLLWLCGLTASTEKDIGWLLNDQQRKFSGIAAGRLSSSRAPALEQYWHWKAISRATKIPKMTG